MKEDLQIPTVLIRGSAVQPSSQFPRGAARAPRPLRTLDKLDKNGLTPLHHAVRRGDAGAVKILLAQDDVSLNKPDNTGRIPLLVAACYGHEGVVKMLLEGGDVRPDKPGNYDKTPLWSAARNGHEGVVKILLARDDINPESPTSQLSAGKHHSGGLPWKGAREW